MERTCEPLEKEFLLAADETREKMDMCLRSRYGSTNDCKPGTYVV